MGEYWLIFYLGIGFVIIFINHCFTQKIPILMYHHIGDWDEPYTVSANKFNEQLSILRQKGYQTITLSMLYEHFKKGKKLPGKPIVITFDDAYEDVYVNALPILKQFSMVATTFVVTQYVGDYNYWDSYPNKPLCRHMSWETLSLWLDQGMEVGSHSVTHPHLSKLSKKEILDQIQNSKLLLEEKLKTPINFFCYPYGDFNDFVKKCLQISDYQGALAIWEGTGFWHNDLFALKRICITHRLTLTRFKLLIFFWLELYKVQKLKTFAHNFLTFTLNCFNYCRKHLD